MSRTPSDTLDRFLSRQKASYLEAVKNGKGKEWTVVTGNEAGDLDSLASAIAYAWHRNTIQKDSCVSLVQTPRPDLQLRAENLHALEMTGVDPSHLLCIDDVHPLKPFPSSKFALVDHNRLGTQFKQDNPEARVVAIIDHHEDEGLHQNSADPRIIVVPTGSAASLVTRYLAENSQDEIPPELATLLLCGILVDTNGLKPGGKAEQIDRDAAAFLAPRSLLSTSDLAAGDLHDSPEVQDLNATLQSKKGDVSHLGTRDLLRRDYKEYTFQPSWTDQSIIIGLSSVPVGLHPWITEDKSFWSATKQWMDERNLTAIGILTSFRDDHKLNKHGKGKHRREQLYVVREGGSAEGIAERLFDGLKHSKELDLKKRSFQEDYGVEVDLSPEHTFRAKVWEQGNADATRKVTAPLVKKIIED